MPKRFLPLFVVLAAVAVPLQAQGFEFTPYIAQTWSEGVEINEREVEGQRYNKLTPVSGFTWGFQADLNVGESFAIGFNFADQASKLEGSIVGGGKREFTDMRVRNYHAIFTYNTGEVDDRARGYIFGGLGATQYAPDDIMGQSVEGNTRFSTTWGGGIKLFFSDHVGARFGGRWTPTYIRSEPGGIWCSPYWPGACWVLSDDKYSHQFELSGGIIFRFGVG